MRRSCGWDNAGGYYDCGFEGSDPGGTPRECPPALIEGAPCQAFGVVGAGCCDANGDNWYCTDAFVLFKNACG